MWTMRQLPSSLCTEAAGGHSQEPELVFPLWEHLLGRAIGPPKLRMVTWAALSSRAGPCPGSSWRKARIWLALGRSSVWPFLLFLGPSDAPTHFSVTSSGQKAPLLAP